MTLKELIASCFNVQLPISGGNGLTVESPIVIEKEAEEDYVRIEYEIINYLNNLEQHSWKRYSQRLLFVDGKNIDEVTIQLFSENETESLGMKEYFFDISIGYNL